MGSRALLAWAALAFWCYLPAKAAKAADAGLGGDCIPLSEIDDRPGEMYRAGYNSYCEVGYAPTGCACYACDTVADPDCPSEGVAWFCRPTCELCERPCDSYCDAGANTTCGAWRVPPRGGWTPDPARHGCGRGITPAAPVLPLAQPLDCPMRPTSPASRTSWGLELAALAAVAAALPVW